MATYTLDDIREAADKKYGGLTIELGEGHNVTLRNMLRLSREERGKIEQLRERDDESIEETIEGLREAVLMLADSSDNGRALLDMIGDDAALLIHIFKTWQDQTQAGEAQPSES